MAVDHKAEKADEKQEEAAVDIAVVENVLDLSLDFAVAAQAQKHERSQQLQVDSQNCLVKEVA